MSVRPIDPIVVHRAYCNVCGAVLEDTDPERLGTEMDAHERECPCR